MCRAAAELGVRSEFPRALGAPGCRPLQMGALVGWGVGGGGDTCNYATLINNTAEPSLDFC